MPWARFNKKTFRDDELNSKVICEFFKSMTFNQISPLLVEKFKKQRRDSITRYGRQRRPASVNREIATLSRIFSLAVENGLLETNPCRKVKKLTENNERKRYLSVEEEERLMNVLTGKRVHLKPLITLAIHTGMRRGELLNLKWENVDFARGIIHVTHTKTNKDRDIPMNSVVMQVLLELQSQTKQQEFVFNNSKTGVNLTDVKKGFQAACKEAGIVDFKFHDLRHTAGTRLADAGADAFAIAEILGHGSLQMTKRYTHATDERKREALEALTSFSSKNCQKIVKNEKRQSA